MSQRIGATVSRIGYLDGLRGLAAIQVVIGHYSLAFLNDPQHLGFAGNGNFAVYVFFLMSGFVLTYSFERDPGAISRNLVRRLIRLGLPLATAALCAALLLWAFHEYGDQAASISGSEWLSRYSVFPSASDITAEATGLRMLTGFSDTTIFYGADDYLPGLAGTLDPPTWTLHIELWGSILVMLLVCCRAKAGSLYPWIGVATLIVAGVHPLSLFVIGHFVAAYRHRIPERLLHSPLSAICGFFLIATGIYLAAAADPPEVWRLKPLPDLSVFHQPFLELKDEAGAIAVFLAIFLAAPLRRALDIDVFKRLGKLSFSLYLVHFPIMVTFGSVVFVYSAPSLSTRGAAAIALVIGMAVSLVLAAVFERCVDRPAILLSRRVGARRQFRLA